MCRKHHDITRRELLGLGLGTMAGMLVVPDILRATPPLRSATFGASLGNREIALKAAHWVRAARVETRSGAAWPANPLKPGSVEYDLYNGMPGVVLFQLELFHATGDRAWLDDARLGANEIIAQLPSVSASGSCGLYEGLGGLAFVLEETHRATGDGTYRDAARRAVAMIHEHAVKTGSGVAWTNGSATNDIISGAAGIGLTLLWADRTFGDPASRELAAAAGRRLVDVGIRESGGVKWDVAPSVKQLYPNFSHGTGGVAYFLATLHQAMGERAFLEAALSGAHYLEAVANTDDGGFKVFHHEPGGENLFYLSWCHGPAGTSRLFYRLGEITHDEHWHDLIHKAARATIAMGVPERQSSGYWNNISQCCGNCGVGEYFIALQRVLPDAAYATMIDRVAANTFARATTDGDGLKWVQAENRVSPDDVIAQTGYMQGASGVGSLYLHIDAAQARREPAIVWPDSPF
jgi:lantibiotic modifying enzyme